jgi:hypothetical protein
MKRLFTQLLASFKKSRSCLALSSQRRARLEVESLEDRELLSTAPLPLPFKIVPTVSVRDSGGTYNGHPFAATASATGLGGRAVRGTTTFAYWHGSSARGPESATAPTQAGTYTVVAYFTSSDPHYSNASSAAVTFTITPATPTITVTNPVPMRVLVPAYFYPDSGGSDWDRLDAAAGRVPLTAIVNPNDGPDTGINSDYVSAVSKLQAAGGQVIGYVHTSYGTIPLATIKAEINDYRLWYHVNGIFIDEMTSDADPANLAYYQAIYRYAHSLQSNWTVVGNPGTSTTEDYVRLPVADVLVTYEDDTGYGSSIPSSWQQKYAANRFANIIYGVSSVAAMQADVKLAASRGIGWLYISNLDGDNPYDALPSYWSQFLSAVESTALGAITGHYFRASATATGVNGAVVSGSFRFLYYPGTTVPGFGTLTPPIYPGTYTMVAEFFSLDPNYHNAQSHPITFTIYGWRPLAS